MPAPEPSSTLDQSGQAPPAAAVTPVPSATQDPSAPDAPGGTLGASPEVAAAARQLSRPFPDVPGYQILDKLGAGGMGVVYKARQVRAGRLVALKMVLHGSHAAPAEVARFRREAEAGAALAHPHIVQVYEVGEHAGRPYFSQELCPGGPLTDKLGHKTQPPREAALLLEKVTRAVQHAHQGA